MMRKNLFMQFFVGLVVGMIFFTSASKVLSGCNCTHFPYGQTYIGAEYMALSYNDDPCPQSSSDPIDFDSISYEYKEVAQTYCKSSDNGTTGTIDQVYGTQINGPFDTTPTNMTTWWQINYSGLFNLIRNKSGTHFIFVHYKYIGIVAGVSFNGTTTGKTYTIDDFNVCCGVSSLVFTPPDADNDGYTDCIDCLPNDNDNYGTCMKKDGNLGGGC